MSHAPSSPPAEARRAVAVGIVALTVRADQLTALLVGGAGPAGELPGGFVRAGESLPQAARRELAQATGAAPPGHLEQLRTYDPLPADPRGEVLTVAYLLLAPSWEAPAPGRQGAQATLPGPGGQAGQAAWRPVEQASGLAFDHGRILADG
ncbi:MAG: NUDIX domain-containing protein, partial [Bifidobacteriaceae bacterium]|nr:NUDIX domain-containing protein [Bifidobacteriaceae bacterium]